MLSPGVEVKEIDLSLRVDQTSNSIACFGGIFTKGPVDEKYLITSVTDFISYYGLPTNTNFNDWFQVSNFLQYANKIWVTRAFNDESGNSFGYVNKSSVGGVQTSTEVADKVFIKNSSDFEQMFLSSASADVLARKPKFLNDDNKLMFTSRSFGMWGNKLSIGIANKADFVQGKKVAGYRFEDLFEYHPGQEIARANVLATSDVGNITSYTVGAADFNVGSVKTEATYYTLSDLETLAGFTVGSMIDDGQGGEVEATQIDVETAAGVSEGDVKDSEVLYTLEDYEAAGGNGSVVEGTTGELHLSYSGSILEVAGESVLVKIIRDGVTTYELLPIITKDYDANLNLTTLVCDVTFGGDINTAWKVLPTDIILIPASKEVGVVVCYDGAIVEKYIVSMDETAKDYTGSSIYIENVINRASQYVFTIVSSIEEIMPASLNDSTGLLQLNGGNDTTSAGDIINCYATSTDGGLFSNKEEVDIDIIISNESCQAQAIELANDRADCIAFIGAKASDAVCTRSADAVNNLIQYLTVAENGINYNTSFAAFFGNYKYMYDKYNDVYRWVNIAGDVAGLRADTSTKREIWWASAGIERGQIANCIKLAFNPTAGERDLLYKNKINPIVSFPGQGNAIVWGQKTMQSTASAFDRINVRGLFNTLERAISVMAKNYVFELNDEFTRSRFETTVSSYLRQIKANRGVYDFYVRCNEDNNTPTIVDNNQFIADIAIKPTRTAEFITLNFIALSTGVEFNTIFA